MVRVIRWHVGMSSAATSHSDDAENPRNNLQSLHGGYWTLSTSVTFGRCVAVQLHDDDYQTVLGSSNGMIGSATCLPYGSGDLRNVGGR